MGLQHYKYYFEKIVFKNLANTYNILVFNKEVTLQCTHRTSNYQESEKSQILLSDSLGPFSHAPSHIMHAYTQAYPLFQSHMHAASADTSGAEVANVSNIQKEDEDGECLYCTIKI